MTFAPHPSDNELIAALHRLNVNHVGVQMTPDDVLSLLRGEEGRDELRRILWERIAQADAEAQQ